MPRHAIRQGVLGVPLLLDAIAGGIAGAGWPRGDLYVAGLALYVLATVIAVVRSRRVLSAGLMLLVPLLDLAAIGLMCVAPSGKALLLLVVLPAMWLAVDHGMNGVLTAVSATAGLVSVPALVLVGSRPEIWSLAALVPTLAGICALTMASTAQVWARQNHELELQGARLKDALAQVTANQALNDAIVTAVDVGLISLDRDGRFRSVNPRMREFLNLAYPDAQPDRIGAMGLLFAADRTTRLTHDDLPAVRAARGEELADVVMWVGDDPGTQRALSVSARRVLDANGDFDGAVLAYHDITDLMAALRAKEEFVASVSHELRTPLTSIIGYLDLVLERDQDTSAAARRQLSVVKRNSTRLLGLVSDLLFSAQNDGAQVVLDSKPVDVAAVAEQALNDIAPWADAELVMLQPAISGPAMVVADPVRLRQMVDNLVGNAIKYTPAGGTIVLRVVCDDEQVELAVSDTGIGIAESELPRVFDRFFRSPAANALAIQGIGLGLAITKSIVEAHGGEIQVESQVGKGSTFTVRIPTGYCETTPQDNPVAQAAGMAGAAVVPLPGARPRGRGVRA